MAGRFPSLADCFTFFAVIPAAEVWSVALAVRSRDGKATENEVQTRDRIVKEFGRTETIRILNKKNISENEIIRSLLIENGGGRTETPRMKVQRIGDEWKMAESYQQPAQKTQ